MYEQFVLWVIMWSFVILAPFVVVTVIILWTHLVLESIDEVLEGSRRDRR